MYLFPEPAYRTGRRFLVVAAILSIVIHLIGGGLWGFLVRAVVPKSASQSGQLPEIVALSDAITIEHRTVPREARRAVERRPVHVARPPAVAAAARRPLPTPTLRELATVHPVAVTTPRPVPAQPVVVHRSSTAAPVVPPSPPPNGGAFSPQQMAALDSQFSRTIAAAQRAVSEAPAQRGAVADVRPQRERPSGERVRDAQIMGGSPDEVRAQHFVSGEGDCVALQGPMPAGRLRGYYLRCIVRYSDGYFEQVSFPWPFYFAPKKDPFDYHDNPNNTMVFPGQDPPGGFVLSANFALSRTLCAYFKQRCAAIVDAEKNRGEPAYGKPP